MAEENFAYEHWDDILDICKKYDVLRARWGSCSGVRSSGSSTQALVSIKAGTDGICVSSDSMIAKNHSVIWDVLSLFQQSLKGIIRAPY